MAHSTDVEPRFILYAPGIHTGGGLALLTALLTSAQIDSPSTTLLLDARALAHGQPTGRAVTIPIRPSIAGRLKAERQLQRLARPDDTLLCLHSLPPLLPTRARTLCFVQNILHLGGHTLRDYPLKTRLRLQAERLIGRLLRSRVDTYLVQTRSMADRLRQWHGANPHIRIAPFVPPLADAGAPGEPEAGLTDFVYVADGLPHKNHLHLVAAWVLLADAGIRPRLTLTLTQRDARLRDRILTLSREHQLNIDIRGALPHDEVCALYRASGALIYPSYAESLGLPLLEAAQFGVPIIASERDYVRDVCRPTETFDPDSPRSIARAVRRFLSVEEAPQPLLTAQTFIDALFEPADGCPAEGSD